MRRVLFFRDFHGFTGGHLKVWHYFAHLASSKSFCPEIYFAPGSRMDDSNPWITNGVVPQKSWNVGADDIVFLAGLDWQLVPDAQRLERAKTPIVNLIQGLRHADADDPRSAFLQRPATRICISEEVADAIRKTGRVNGPVFTVRAAIDLGELPPPASDGDRDITLLILGAKNPAFAARLGRVLTDRRIDHQLLADWLPRSQYLDILRRSSTAVILPLEAEGFFLPALEAMALQTLLICPDCVGNRGHCIDGTNCLRPVYRLEEVVGAITRAGALKESERLAVLQSASATVSRHGLGVETAQVIRIFEGLS